LYDDDDDDIKRQKAYNYIQKNYYIFFLKKNIYNKKFPFKFF